MATVKFYGDLKRFEPTDSPLELCVESFGELMSGLLTQLVGLRQRIAQGYYKVRIGKNTYLSEDEIKSNAVLLDDNSVVHITPVVKGAGKGGNVFQIIAGVVLIVASIYVPALAPYSAQLMAVGASLAISGAMGLLARPPSMDGKIGDSEKLQSTSFSNIRNLTPQGRPIPLLYGEMLTSWVLISQGISSFDEITPEEKAKHEEERKQAEEKAKQAEAREREYERIREEKAQDARDAREEREAREEAEREAKEQRDRELAEEAMG